MLSFVLAVWIETGEPNISIGDGALFDGGGEFTVP